MSRKRLSCGAVIAASVAAVSLSGGCQPVNVKRLTMATRIDVRSNQGWAEFEAPFDVQRKRLENTSRVTCTAPASLTRIGDFLSGLEDKWENWWLYPPPPPPIVLEFYRETQWLGSIDVYDWALGHTHNMIYRVEPEEAAELIRLLCDCAGAPEPS